MELTNLKKRTYERCTLKNRSCDWKDLLAAMASVFLASTITIWKKIADQSCNWRFPKFLGLIFYATLTRQGLLLKSLKNNQSWTFVQVHWWYYIAECANCFVPAGIESLRDLEKINTCMRFSIDDFPWSIFNVDKPPTTGIIVIIQLSLRNFLALLLSMRQTRQRWVPKSLEKQIIFTWNTNPSIDDIYYRLPTASSCILCDWEFSWPRTVPASGSLSTILLALFSTQTSRLLQARLPFSNCLLQNFLAASPFF